MTVLQSRHNREFCERQAIARQGLYSCLESYILSVQITEKMFSVFLEIVSRCKEDRGVHVWIHVFSGNLELNIHSLWPMVACQNSVNS